MAHGPLCSIRRNIKENKKSLNLRHQWESWFLCKPVESMSHTIQNEKSGLNVKVYIKTDSV